VIVPKEVHGSLMVGRIEEAVIEHEPPRIGHYHLIDWPPIPATVKLLDAWPCKHGGHVIRFRVEHMDRPHLLHRDAWKGYTHLPHLALKGEKEAVDQRTLERFSDEARWARKAELREQLALLEQQLSKAQDAFRAAGIEPTSEVRLMERRIQALKRKAA
jgi:hypothetical protein